MTDGKIISAVLRRYDEKRREKEELIQKRKEKVYREIPQLYEIDNALRATSFEIISAALKNGDDVEGLLNTVKSRNQELRNAKERLLTDNGYPTDYLAVKYDCEKCEDRGYIGATMCECLKSECKAQRTRELSKMLPIENENFDTFNLDLYSTAEWGNTGISPRENMSRIYDFCIDYSVNFSKSMPNLLFNGSTGLGKTFLCSCIARVVAEKGFSVVYDTVVNIVNAFEAEKFGHATDETAEDIKRYAECDLLIIDDLGTEFPTQFSQTALYTIINNRIMSGKKMIVNTNLSMEEIEKKYSVQIVSRLEGEFINLPFYGEDIRIKRQMQRMGN